VCSSRDAWRLQVLLAQYSRRDSVLDGTYYAISHRRDLQSGQPVRQRQQIGGQGAEGAGLTGDAAFGIGDTDRHDNRLLVDIETSPLRMQQIDRSPPGLNR
jgi:hypothetical protein